MMIERDSTLQSLFDVAKQDLAGETFVAQVMSQIDSLRRRAVIGRICVGLVMVACGWLLASLLQDVVLVLTQFLRSPLIELDISGLSAQLLAPVNSIAALVALGLLGLQMAYRKIFS